MDGAAWKVGFMTTGNVGDLSELIVLTALVADGRQVAIPYGNRPGYDLLVLGSDGAWKRLQVKTAYQRSQRSGSIYCDFLRGSGKGKRRVYTVQDFDFLIAALHKPRTIWVFNVSEVVGKRCRTIRFDDMKHHSRIDLI